MGSGKSYIAQELFSHLLILNPDNFMDAQNFSRESAHLAWDMIHSLIKQHLVNKSSFVLDSSMALSISRKRITQYIREIEPDCKIICIYLEVDLEDCIIRNSCRERVVCNKKIKEYWQNIVDNPPSKHDGFDEIIMIDNSYRWNEGDVWKTTAPWPQNWYREYHEKSS